MYQKLNDYSEENSVCKHTISTWRLFCDVHGETLFAQNSKQKFNILQKNITFDILLIFKCFLWAQFLTNSYEQYVVKWKVVFSSFFDHWNWLRRSHLKIWKNSKHYFFGSLHWTFLKFNIWPSDLVFVIDNLTKHKQLTDVCVCMYGCVYVLNKIHYCIILFYQTWWPHSFETNLSRPFIRGILSRPFISWLLFHWLLHCFKTIYQVTSKTMGLFQDHLQGKFIEDH